MMYSNKTLFKYEMRYKIRYLSTVEFIDLLYLARFS